MSINVCIFGVSGYTGATLLKFLNKHKNVNLIGVFGNKTLGTKIRLLFPNLNNLPDIKISDYKKFKFEKVDLIFSCLPHGKFQREIFPKIKFIFIKVICYTSHSHCTLTPFVHAVNILRFLKTS